MPRFRPLLGVLAALVLAAAARPARAQAAVRSTTLSALPPTYRDPLHDGGENVTVTLLTMGDGDQVWEMFGHSAFWLHDNVSGRDTVFNWGEFDSTKPHFILHFLQGLMWYAIGGETIQDVLYSYRYWNRTVLAQQLDLTAAEKDSLLAIIRVNEEPQNVFYRYNYFLNNCATRPRDILDRVLHGQLRAGAQRPAGVSFRWQALRLMQANLPLDVGVDIGLGAPADQPITVWENMFLPEALHDYVAALEVRDSTGAPHPLVRRSFVMYQAQGRPPEPSAPPPLGLWLTGLGVVLAAAFLVLGHGAEHGWRGARAGTALLSAVWSLAAGLLGVVLTVLWTMTDHAFAYYNINLLLFNPLWLALAPLAPLALLRGTGGRWARPLALVTAALAVLALVAHAGISRQQNLPLVGLALPPAVAMAVVLWLVRGRPGSR